MKFCRLLAVVLPHLRADGSNSDGPFVIAQRKGPRGKRVNFRDLSEIKSVVSDHDMYSEAGTMFAGKTFLACAVGLLVWLAFACLCLPFLKDSFRWTICDGLMLLSLVKDGHTLHGEDLIFVLH